MGSQTVSMLQTPALSATKNGMLLSEREKLLERRSQEEKHKTLFMLSREPEEQKNEKI